MSRSNPVVNLSFSLLFAGSIGRIWVSTLLFTGSLAVAGVPSLVATPQTKAPDQLGWSHSLGEAWSEVTFWSQLTGDWWSGPSAAKSLAISFTTPATLLTTGGGCGASFSQPAGSPVGVGGRPNSVVVEDFNRDSKADLAVANSFSDNVTILLGDGGGSFAQAAGSPIAVGTRPSSMGVGDFNLDGNSDLAVPNTDSANMTILLGNGSGGFAQATGSPVGLGSSPTFVAVGNFNTDNKPDLAVTNFFSNTVMIFLGDGNGGFTQAADSPIATGTGTNPRSISIDDFNQDGKPDLAVAKFSQNLSSGSVMILLGNGSGGFTQAAGSPVNTGSGSFWIVASNFNLDNKPDLAVANSFSRDVTILLGDGNGGFTQAADSPIAIGTGTNPKSIAVGDFDLDGKRDLAVTNDTTPGSVTILLGNGSGGFTQAGNSPVSTGRQAFSVAVGDFNLDAKSDLTVTSFLDNNVTILLNSCNINPGLMFFPLARPVRLLDTRSGVQACFTPGAPIPGGMSLTQLARGLCDGLDIPADAKAITGNITTVQSGGGYLTLYPSNAQQPVVANSNYGPNEILNNAFTVGLGNADGAFKIFALNTTDVVVDVTGYYAPPSTGGLYFHLLPAPVRLLDTRAGQLACVTPGTPLPGNAESTQQAVTPCTGIPPAARAIVGNATTVGPQGGGFLTLFPDETTRPLVASSNYNPGQIVNGPFSVGLAPNGQFKIYTFATTDLVVDVLGYYSTEATDVNGAGLLFNPLPKPVRLLETRPNLPVGCFKPGAPLSGQQEYTQSARGVCDGVTVPNNALGVVGNATVVSPNGPGFLTLWPSTAQRPLVATANYNPADVINRHFFVGLGNADSAFKMYSLATSHLVVDLSGYFAP